MFICRFSSILQLKHLVVLEAFLGGLLFPAPVCFISCVHVGILSVIWEGEVEGNPKIDSNWTALNSYTWSEVLRRHYWRLRKDIGEAGEAISLLREYDYFLLPLSLKVSFLLSFLFSFFFFSFFFFSFFFFSFFFFLFSFFFFLFSFFFFLFSILFSFPFIP
jgi:hypothetical protein